MIEDVDPDELGDELCRWAMNGLPAERPRGRALGPAHAAAPPETSSAMISLFIEAEQGDDRPPARQLTESGFVGRLTLGQLVAAQIRLLSAR